MPREINIKPVLNGFVCQVGCQTLVFDTVRSLAVAVEEYFNHPEETEKRFLEKAINKMEGPRPPERNQVRDQDCCGTIAPDESPIHR